ncbi:proline-specific permease protein [Rutstroemia sp. NJR-2017a BBW]|nr:proline-specific permease protein [Rutstroemia sp. NJR-2017a BBW]
MDHEKPQAVSPPQVFEFDIDHSRTSPEDLEPDYTEERRERRGESLWRTLTERHINPSLGMYSRTRTRVDNKITNDHHRTIGNGLFLGSGRSLASGGPGGAVMAYIIMGTVVSSVISCLGEMTALMPVNAPVVEFPRRFLDRGVGFAVGWMYWFAWAVTAAEELVAVSGTLGFHYDDGRTFLAWKTGESVDPAVWIGLFLIIATIINMFPVRYFGELEYAFGCIKIIFITMLIALMLILDTKQHWSSPWGFFNHVYHVRGESGEVQREITGGTGSFLGMWTTIINVIFSYTGMDIVAATAAESKALANAESMKMAARKICIRIVTLYTMAMITASFVVPYTHPFINGKGQSVGAHSIFVIAVVEAGLPAAAHFFNAIFVFASFTCAINSMYVASRVLHTLALQDQTGPEFITRRLRQTRSGVPIRAVLATAAMALVAFMGRTGTTALRLSELASNCTSSLLIVYATICATYLGFYRTLLTSPKDICTDSTRNRLEDTKLYGNASERQAAHYDRNHPRYPYKSHGQWLKGFYGMTACIILVTFNGVSAFLERPFDVRRFVASYISIPVFILLIIGYKIHKHGLRIRNWGPERSNDLRNTIQAASETRKGRLEFPDEGLSWRNFKTWGEWFWVWLK